MKTKDELTADVARLKGLLFELKMTHKEAARVLGISMRTITRYCNGRTHIPGPVFVALEALLKSVRKLPPLKKSR